MLGFKVNQISSLYVWLYYEFDTCFLFFAVLKFHYTVFNPCSKFILHLENVSFEHGHHSFVRTKLSSIQF